MVGASLSIALVGASGPPASAAPRSRGGAHHTSGATPGGGALWTSVAALGGEGRFDGVSCTAAATCVAAGEDDTGHAIYAAEANGAWDPATQLGASPTVPSAPTHLIVIAGERSVTISWTAPSVADGPPASVYVAQVSPGGASCHTTAIGCTITGLTDGRSYTIEVSAANSVGTGPPAHYAHPFIPGAPVRLRLRASRSTVTYGNEPKETLYVSAEPETGKAIPAGTVVVAAGAVRICSIVLRHGDGYCELGKIRVDAAFYRPLATYLGSTRFATTTSAATAFTVLPAPSSTSLILRLTTVRLTHENGVTLWAFVTPRLVGGPRGTVTVTAGSLTLCSFGLAAAPPNGTCTLTPSQLPIGVYELVAHYQGRGNFKPSVSIEHKLRVVAA
jgi:hypothetical protein